MYTFILNIDTYQRKATKQLQSSLIMVEQIITKCTFPPFFFVFSSKEKSSKDNIVVEMKSDNTEEAILLGVNGEKQPPSDQVNVCSQVSHDYACADQIQTITELNLLRFLSVDPRLCSLSLQ